MTSEVQLPISWRGECVGTVLELSADMFWFHARWAPTKGDAEAAFLAAVAAGEDPEVLIGDAPARRFVVTAATEDELELKSL